MARGEEFYLEAFTDLSTCRSFGFGLGPIPWHRIVEYGERFGLEPDLLRVFVHVIQSLDKLFLEDREREAEDRRRRELDAVKRRKSL